MGYILKRRRREGGVDEEGGREGRDGENKEEVKGPKV